MSNELVDGQIYRWRWTEAERAKFQAQGINDPYWCKSNIAVVEGGRLFDTYWSDTSKEVKPEQVELTLVGNTAWPKVTAAEALRYDSADICDMRHRNTMSAPIYVRPGAQLNQKAILEVIAQRVADAESALRIAQWRLEELAKSREAAEAGRLSEVRF